MGFREVYKGDVRRNCTDMETKLTPRSEIPVELTWNAPSVFPTVADWEAACEQVPANLAKVASFQGHLAEGPQVLLQALEAIETLLRQVGKIYVYANMSYSVDTTDQNATRMNGRAQGLFGQALAGTAFMDPELIAIGKETLMGWVSSDPKLAFTRHYIDDLFRKQAHVRSSEVEELLGMLVDPFGSLSNTMSVLTDADFKFKPAISTKGKEIPVDQGAIYTILGGADREARRTAFEHYTDMYLGFKNTLANNLQASIKANVFMMRARRHASTLEASLFENNIPVEVFHNLIETYRKNLPTWHRYWSIRRKALGVDTLHPYDIWAPINKKPPVIPYAQAVEWICQGLAPMGEEYISILRKGCLEERWVDVMPNQGKTQGAFSGGWLGTHPFILISYDGSFQSLSALAHELGHSMHSYYTWKSQPFIYSNYSLFLAEVASNFHQAMVRGYLLENGREADFQIAVIEEAMSNFHRYFFIMPTLARFELEIHQREERGQGISADDLIDLMADLFTEAYGGEMHVDRQRVGITWATFPHLYMDYYVYQYATGIAGANALAGRILSGTDGAVDGYMGFIKAGSSAYALDVLKAAGVDLSTPQPVEETFAVLRRLVDRLEMLVG